MIFITISRGFNKSKLFKKIIDILIIIDLDSLIKQ